jgi:hypothetical protein
MSDPFAGLTGSTQYLSNNKVVSINFSPLVDMINTLGLNVKSKIALIRSKKSSMSIADMFDLQSAVQKLSQFTEMSSSVVSSINGSMSTMSRNMKG